MTSGNTNNQDTEPEVGLVVIDSVGVVSSPVECSIIDIPIQFTTTGIVIHGTWSIEGVLPIGVEFTAENNNPRLYGRIKMFIDQVVIDSSLFYPKEELKMDGSNRMNNGDFKENSYSFDFTIKHQYKSVDTTSGLESEKEASSVVSIVLSHMENKRNTMFMKSYLAVDILEEVNDLVIDNGVVSLVVKLKPREIPYNGRIYRKNDSDDLLRDHPGPFSICEGS